MAKATSSIYPTYVEHPKCGATIRVDSDADMPDDQTDCPVCTAVKTDFQKSAGIVNRATAGTPLAQELGLVVFTGKPGPAQ